MASKTIVLKGSPPRYEGKAGASGILPGDLLYESALGTVAVHATEGGNSERLFAIENGLEGTDIDHAYSADERVQCVHAQRGDEIYAWLADGENASFGDMLTSKGSGGDLKVASVSHNFSDSLAVGNVYVEGIVGKALEAVNLTASSNLTAHGRIKIRVL